MHGPYNREEEIILCGFCCLDLFCIIITVNWYSSIDFVSQYGGTFGGTIMDTKLAAMTVRRYQRAEVPPTVIPSAVC